MHPTRESGKHSGADVLSRVHCEVCGSIVDPSAVRRIRSDVLCPGCLETIHHSITKSRPQTHGHASAHPSSSRGNGGATKGGDIGDLARQIRLTTRTFQFIGAVIFLLLLVEIAQLVRAM